MEDIKKDLFTSIIWEKAIMVLGRGIGHIVNILLLLVLLSSCNFKIVPEFKKDEPEAVKTKYSEQFKTQMVRELWQVCSESFRRSNPLLDTQRMYNVCDCYVDYMRENYTADQIQKLPEGDAKILGKQLSKNCNNLGQRSLKI